MVAPRAAQLGRDCAIIPVHAGTLSQRPHLAAACWSAMEHHETHETDDRENPDDGKRSLERRDCNRGTRAEFPGDPQPPGQSSPETLAIIGNESGTARKISRAEFPGDPRDHQGRVPWRPPNTPGQSSPGTLDTIWKECGTTRKITRAELPRDPQSPQGSAPRGPWTAKGRNPEHHGRSPWQGYQETPNSPGQRPPGYQETPRAAILEALEEGGVAHYVGPRNQAPAPTPGSGPRGE